jgi:uncharacterized protein
VFELSSVTVAVVAAFFVAGLVKGVIGLGLPTIAVGMLSLVMPPLEAAAILVVPSLVTNVWQVAAGQRLIPLARRLAPLLIGIFVGTLIGGHLVGVGSGKGAAVLLGGALIVYAVLGLLKVRLHVAPSHERWLSPVLGVANGLITMVTGIFVIPATPYIQALGFERDDLVQALGIMFLASTVALSMTLTASGLLTSDVARGSLLALAAALGGMGLGQVLRSRIPDTAFRTCFFGGLLLLGLHIALRSVLS